MFNQPANETGSMYFKPAQHNECLVLFETVIESGREFDQMTNSEREYRVVTFVDLDGDCTPTKAKVTHKGLVAKLPVDGTNILGRVKQVKTSNGYNAWVLEPYTDADAKQAKAWIDGGRKGKIDPMAANIPNADGVTPEMLATLQRLGMLKSDEPGF